MPSFAIFSPRVSPRLFLGHSEFIQGKGQVKKMRKLFLLLPAIALILSLSAYGRENVWLSVASASPAAHPVRMSSTTAPEHDWVGATCTTAAVCRICGETRGRALGHEWEPAACVEPKTCRICGATQGSALTHDWVLTDSSSPKTCRRCGMTEGSEPEVYTYLCDMTPIQRFGKLWIRSEEPLGVYAHTPADHPGCWDDLNTPGHSLGPVRDYEGNSYRYSMHLDSNTTAACYVTYRLDGQYNTFSGVCAYPGDAISRATVHATKYFRVYADDKLIFTSAQMNINTPPAPFSIDVTGVRVLRIEYPSSENPNEAAALYDARLS